MYLFFTLEQIAAMKCFESFNILLMSDFERIMILVVVNILYILFLSFILTILYKSFLWLRRILF